MNAIATLLLLVTLPNPLTTLVLRSGDRVEVADKAREENGQLVFRGGDGLLYSLSLEEVDLEASRTASQPAPPDKPRTQKKLRVAKEERKRLLAELQQNHGGTAPVEQPALNAPIPPPKAKAEVREERDEEQSWRRQARDHEENVRRAEENVQMLRARLEQLNFEIAGLLSLGYKPAQFSYQTTQLQTLKEQLPWAELEVRRAERAFVEFREDARKQGIMPGWLR